MKKKSHIKNYRITIFDPKFTKILSQTKAKKVDEIRVMGKSIMLYHVGDEQPFVSVPAANSVVEEIV